MHMSKLFNAKPIHWSYWIAVSGLWLGLLLANRSDAGVNWGPIVKYTGQISWYLLAFTVYISLLSRSFPTQTWLAKLFSMRKHTGIAAFLFALLHLLGEYMKRSSWSDIGIIEFLGLTFDSTNTMFFAWLGLLFMLPAFVTSCATAIKKLGFKKWKALQRLVHISFIFAALHIGLLPYVRGGSVDWEPIVTIGIYALGYLLLVNKLDKQGRKKIFSAGKIGAVIFVAMLLMPNPTLAGDGTGMDEVFKQIGMEKPAEWNDWSREQKFDFLQSNGIYPLNGNKYQGQADLTEYYKKTAQESPEKTPTDNTPKTSPPEPPSIWFKIYLAIVALVMGAGLILASYKVDWLRANKPKG